MWKTSEQLARRLERGLSAEQRGQYSAAVVALAAKKSTTTSADLPKEASAPPSGRLATRLPNARRSVRNLPSHWQYLVWSLDDSFTPACKNSKQSFNQAFKCHSYICPCTRISHRVSEDSIVNVTFLCRGSPQKTLTVVHICTYRLCTYRLLQGAFKRVRLCMLDNCT